MFLPSIGFRCGTIRSNDGTLTSGTRISVPESCAGSTAPMSRSTATIDAYSVPCEPDTTASTGPGFAPCATTTAMLSAGSAAAGTSMAPEAFSPRAAFAVPTVKVARPWPDAQTANNPGRTQATTTRYVMGVLLNKPAQIR